MFVLTSRRGFFSSELTPLSYHRVLGMCDLILATHGYLAYYLATGSHHSFLRYTNVYFFRASVITAFLLQYFFVYTFAAQVYRAPTLVQRQAFLLTKRAVSCAWSFGFFLGVAVSFYGNMKRREIGSCSLGKGKVSLALLFYSIWLARKIV